MQAVGKKNRTSLHSLYYFVLMTRGILCIGTGGPAYKRTRGLLCFGISNNLLEYARIVEAGWGIKAIQIFLHKDEGHYENPADKKTWKPNYHAHIIWDWMNHETGKSFKLNADDMSMMQDMVAEALDMERGRK